jgi:rRNA maturation RNase YbeY
MASCPPWWPTAPQNNMAIVFHKEAEFKLKESGRLKHWIKTVIEKEKRVPGNINYIFVDDKSLLKINLEYLNHNTYTDIITFDYTEGKEVSGDIYISVERIAENAEKFEVSFEEELKRVMIHGVLHLCGYRDKSKADAALMRKKENSSLRLFSPTKK